MLRQVTDGIYEVQAGKQTISVAFLPGTIALYGTAGHQFFRNEGNCKPDHVYKLFPTEEAIIDRAELHKIGLTNKERFNESLERLFAAKKITETERKNLRHFIAACDCAPPQIRQKLAHRGYARLVAHIDFEDRHPAMEATLTAFKEFLRYMTPSGG